MCRLWLKHLLPEVALLTDAFVLAFLIWYRMRKLVVPPSPARALSVPYKLLWALPTTVAEVAVIDETDPPMGSVVSPCPAQAFGPFSPGAVMVCTQVGPANTMASRAMARLKVGGVFNSRFMCTFSFWMFAFAFPCQTHSTGIRADQGKNLERPGRHPPKRMGGYGREDGRGPIRASRGSPLPGSGSGRAASATPGIPVRWRHCQAEPLPVILFISGFVQLCM